MATFVSIRRLGFPLILLGCLAVLWPAVPATAGGIQDIVALTDAPPSPVPGQVIAPIVPLRWDTRCLPVRFRVNDDLDPVPNPLGEDFLPVHDVVEVFRTAADRWNDVPTSFFEIQVVGTTTNPGLRRFDQINEITFRAFPNIFPNVPAVIYSRDFEPILIARPTRSLTDSVFPSGLDLDRDGDVDFTDAIEVCQDLDGDGDIEFPAGAYPAGTIFDVDIIFNVGVSEGDVNLEGFRLTVDAADADADPRSVDLLAAAVQALGIAHGISHASTSQTSDTDGRSATMFPYFDTSDPVAELSHRDVDVDAAATASTLYPEGSATAGPGALQAGDVAYAAAFGILRGEIFHGPRDEPLVGASVLAIDAQGRVVSSAISGQSRFSTDGVNATFFDADFHVLSGRYEIPVPPGTYTLLVEATDDTPTSGYHYNLQGILGDILGQNDHPEDFYSGPGDAAVERRPRQAAEVTVEAGEVISGLDIVTNVTVEVKDFEALDDMGSLGAAPGSYLAVRVSAERYEQAVAEAGGLAVVHGPAFFTESPDDSRVPVFAAAYLAAGTVAPDGTASVNLAQPLKVARPFVAQDFDFSTLWVNEAEGLARRIDQGIDRGAIENLFLVLRLPVDAPTGPSGLPPLVGLDLADGGSAAGTSYTSSDGVTFTPLADVDLLFKLVLSPVP